MLNVSEISASSRTERCLHAVSFSSASSNSRSKHSLASSTERLPRSAFVSSSGLPQYYRGNHGEVSPIRVRPKFMSLYSSSLSKEAENVADGGEEWGAFPGGGADVAPDARAKSLVGARKPLHSHVMHCVHNRRKERRSIENVEGDADLDPQQQRLPDHWLRKIRRRKAHRSPFSALVPGSGGVEATERLELGEDSFVASTIPDDEDEVDESFAPTLTEKTPTRVLFPDFMDPFRSPKSGVKGVLTKNETV